MNKFVIPAAIASTFVGLASLAAIGNASMQKELATCNAGNTAICYSVNETLQDKITNIQYHDRIQTAKFQREAEAKAAKEAEAKQVAARKAAEAKQVAAANAAEAKFRAEGWFELQPGIYGRWCTETCSSEGVIGEASYWLMEVWAKDANAGDIYAQINIVKGGVVVGWTNDTLYLSAGQRGVLTFSKYTDGAGGSYTAQLVKFQARG